MKKFKSLIAVLIVLAMTMAMTLTAFAADPEYKITVTNVQDAKNLKAYKIFDAKHGTDFEGKDTYDRYTLEVTAANKAVYKELKKVTDLEFDETVLDTDGIGTVRVTEKVSGNFVDKFVDVLNTLTEEQLKSLNGGKEGTGFTKNDDGSYSANITEPGYYYVSTEIGAVCMLVTADPTATIVDKTDIDISKKVKHEDGSLKSSKNVEVGDIVTFVITGKVPEAIDQFSKYTYILKDTMSKGLEYVDDSAELTIDGVDVDVTFSSEGTTAAKVTVTPDTTTKVTDIKIDIPVKQFPAGEDIVFTYKAKVTADALSKVSENKVELEYSNDPSNDEDKVKLPSDDDDTVKLYNTKILVKKVDADQTTVELDGAKFVLYRNQKDENGKVITDDNGKALIEYYKFDADDQKATWVKDKTKATEVTTGEAPFEKGRAAFDGLLDGTYYLEETKAPDNYIMLDKPVEVTVTEPSNLAEMDAGTDVIAKANVMNKSDSGVILPSTGGIGTTIFYVIGAILVLFAGVTLVTRKRIAK